jgi:hypothetical protein
LTISSRTEGTKNYFGAAETGKGFVNDTTISRQRKGFSMQSVKVNNAVYQVQSRLKVATDAEEIRVLGVALDALHDASAPRRRPHKTAAEAYGYNHGHEMGEA